MAMQLAINPGYDTCGDDVVGTRRSRTTSDSVPSGRNVVSHTGPKHKQFASEAARLQTFRDWPAALKQTPEELAKAGLFYLGKTGKTNY